MSPAGIIQRFVGFVGVGAVATGIQYAILAFLVEVFAAPPVISSAIGFVVSALANYAMNYHLNFRSTLAHRVALPRFATVAAVGLILNTLTMRLLVVGLDAYYLMAQILTTGVVLLWNFAGSLLWTFAEPRPGATQTPASQDTPP